MQIAGGMMTAFALAAMLATGVSAQAPRPPETLLSKILRIAGLTAAPSQLRGAADDVALGNIWVVDVERGTRRALTTDGGYRSPIFLPNDSTVVALRANVLVRLGPQGGSPITLNEGTSILKLVGVDPTAPLEVVVLLNAPVAGSPLAAVSLQSGRRTPLPFDASSEQQRRVLAQIRAQDRTYGDATVYTMTETKPGLSRPIEWTDVFLKRGGAPPRNVSACDGVNCVQPALSTDGRSVAFVRTDD
jgi:hypothetical protein